MPYFDVISIIRDKRKITDIRGAILVLSTTDDHKWVLLFLFKICIDGNTSIFPT